MAAGIQEMIGGRPVKHPSVLRCLPILLLLFIQIVACSREKPSSPDSITIAVPFDLATLDPHAKDKLGSASILSNIYEGLVATNAQMGIRPSLALTWESPDPYTWIFRLQPSVSFHSGKPLRAKDVVFSYERILQSNDLELRGGYLLNIAGVKALDDLTVELRTKEPTRILLNKLSHIPIVPEGSSAQALASGADGTGPYKLASWKPGVSVRLQRNENYRGKHPEIRTVTFVLGRSPEEAMQGLMSGQYDLIKADSKKHVAAISEPDRFEVFQQDNLFIKYLGFRLAHPAFGDRRVRQAIHLAIDREKLVNELSNYAEAATQLIPRFIFGFNPQITTVRPDLSKARALLREAGFEEGIETRLYARKITAEAASLLSEQLSPAGVRLEVQVLQDGEFFALLESGKADLWLNSGGCSTGDASDLFDTVIHSRDEEHYYGMQNFGRFANHELDQAIERSNGIEKEETRRNALQEIMTSVMDELILVPLFNDQDVYMIDRGFQWSPRADSYILAAEIQPR